MPGKIKIVIFSVTNCICHDQRVLKMAGAVTSQGASVTIIGRRAGKCCTETDLPYRTVRFRMIFRRGFLFYKFFNIRLFFYLLFAKTDLLVANDLDTLLPNYLVSRIRQIPLVFDSHEYFTGVPDVERRPVVKFVWKSIERLVLPGISHCLTVSDSISNQYKTEYGINPLVIRNCAYDSSAVIPYTREELGIPPESILLVLQGTGINSDRGGEELIDAMMMCPDASLMIIGSGDLLPHLREKARMNKLSARVRFIDRLPWNEMMRYTRSADAGMSLDRNAGLNHQFSLPNKLFDYISAGIPVIAGDLPEITKIITQYTCGIIIPSITPGEISQAVNLLNSKRELLDELKKNAVSASAILNWQNEEKIVRDFYKDILESIRR